jgi:hypothetical protein
LLKLASSLKSTIFYIKSNNQAILANRWGNEMKDLTKFKKWTETKRKGRGLLVHFYESQGKQKPYYTKADFAYYNLFSEAQSWIVKGTEGHGIRSSGDKTSRVPCLNCYQINDKLYDALDKHDTEPKKKYEFGIVLSKSALKTYFGEDNVVDVKLWDENKPLPLPANCWRYDKTRARSRLYPFNYCDVVRIRTPKSPLYNIPLVSLPKEAVMGFLVRSEGYDEEAITNILKQKKLVDEVFPIF